MRYKLKLIAAVVIMLIAGFWAYAYYVVPNEPNNVFFEMGIFGSPPRSEFLSSGSQQADAALPAAESTVRKDFTNYGFNLAKAVDSSKITLCYKVEDDSGFDTVGYSKACYFRITALYPISGSYAQSLASFMSNYNVSNFQLSGLLADNEPPCKDIYGNAGANVDVDIKFCPKGVKASQILAYLAVDDNDFNDYEYSSGLDPSIFDINGKHTDTVLSSQTYNAYSALAKADNESSGGVTLVGISENYYSGQVNGY